MRDLRGRTAFITGGDSGIGFGTAQVLCEAGATVVVCGLTEESTGAAAQRLAAHGTAHGVVLDVRDRQAYAEVVDRIDRDHGGVDILFNNAGVGFLGRALDASFEQWDWVVATNLTGVYNGIRTIVPRMIADGRSGHVLATASIAGMVGAPGTIYSATKFGIVGLMESLALELRDTPIGVSVVVPGLVRTNIRNGPTPPGGPVVVDMPKVSGDVPRMEPREVGERVVAAIRENRLHVLTHAEHREALTLRHDALMASVPTDEVDPRRAQEERMILANPVYAAQARGGQRG